MANQPRKYRIGDDGYRHLVKADGSLAKSTATRHDLFKGKYSTASVAKWCGRHGWTLAETRAVLGEMSDSTTIARNWKRGVPEKEGGEGSESYADLSDDEARQMNAMRDANRAENRRPEGAPVRFTEESASDANVDGRLSVDLRRLEATAIDEGYFSPATLQDERQRRLREIVDRRGQPKFRIKLIAAYKGKCAVTGCDAVASLEAAHIVPYSGPQSDHVSNGLLLRADIHTLVDLDLIGIDPRTMTIVLSPTLVATSYRNLQGKRLAVPSDPKDRPNAQALAERWKRFSSGSA